MLLAGAMLLPANAFAASPDDFSDFPTNWSATSMRRAVDNGLLNGSNGLINSNGLLIRAQMATIINRAFGANKTADMSGYTDVLSNAWYAHDMSKAVAMHTFVGSNGLLSPEKPITREEAFTVLARAFALDGGNASVLNGYSDGASVSAWAQSAVAALIENGYVNGANGKLNPKSSITRAEFAKVIGEMADTYADAGDSLSDTIDGSVIVRENGVSLVGKTINGDLIIADGVTAADLSNVTVTGRIVLRGGESGVTFSNTKAGKGILANTDVTVAGSVDAITVGQSSTITVKSGASVGTITANAEGAKITGAGKVESVKANANNVSVTVSGAKVTAAEGTSGVQAGSRKVASGKTETVSNTTSGGGSSSGGSSSGGSSSGGSSSGGSSSGGSNSGTTQQDLVVASQTKLVDLGWSQYVAIRFTDGNSLANCKVLIDGVDVSSACTPVSDNGDIVKWEITSLNPAKAVVSNGSRSQTVTLSNNANPTAPVVASAKTAPDYFLANGPVYVWDYQITNYDNSGSARVTPSKTTFSISKQSTIAYYSPDAVLYQDDDANNIYKVSGNVELMFNYEKGTDAEKAWVDGISNVALVQADESNSTLNANLDYTIELNHPHGNHTVACINVPLGQSNFFSNGRYQLRVTSNGVSRLFPIHVVNETRPEMLQTTEKVTTDSTRVYFDVENMVYGITVPIYRVDLTDPDGNTRELTKIDDWYLIGSTFALYNDNKTLFPKDGKYTLTVYSNGFQTMTKKFTVGNAASQSSSIKLDAISRATASGGGASSSSGSEGGSNTMNANLVFNADLLINAEIMTELGTGNDYATAIVDRWAEMSHDAVYSEGAETIYYMKDYNDAVNTAKTEGKYLSYADFVKEATRTNPNRPYNVKQVLEDNLLGETSDFKNASSFAAPDITLVTEADTESGFDGISEVNEGESATLLVSGKKAADFLSDLSANGELQLNATYPALSKDDYSIDTEKNTITIRADKLKLGENSLVIKTDTFQNVRLTFKVAKVEETANLTLVKDNLTAGTDDVVFTCGNTHDTCDFLKNLYNKGTVKVTTPDGAEKNVGYLGYYQTGHGYTVSYENGTCNLTLAAAQFDEWKTEDGKYQAGEYTLTVQPQYYTRPVSVKFHMNAPEEPSEVEAKDAPKPTQASKFMGDYTLTFGMNNDDYMKAITAIKVNSTDYTKGTVWNNNCYAIAATDGSLSLGSSAFTKENNTVTITADGYKELTAAITKDGKLVTGDDNSNGGDNSGNSGSSDTKVTLPTTVSIEKIYGNYTYYTLTFDNAEWVGKVSGISIKDKDTTYTAVDNINAIENQNNYYLDTQSSMIALYINSSYSPLDLVIAANGCEDLTVHVEAGYFGSASANIVK